MADENPKHGRDAQGGGSEEEPLPKRMRADETDSGFGGGSSEGDYGSKSSEGGLEAAPGGGDPWDELDWSGFEDIELDGKDSDDEQSDLEIKIPRPLIEPSPAPPRSPLRRASSPTPDDAFERSLRAPYLYDPLLDGSGPGRHSLLRRSPPESKEVTAWREARRQEAAAARERDDHARTPRLFLSPATAESARPELIPEEIFEMEYGSKPNDAERQASLERFDGNCFRLGRSAGAHPLASLEMMVRLPNDYFLWIRPEREKVASFGEWVEKYGRGNVWQRTRDGVLMAPDDFDRHSLKWEPAEVCYASRVGIPLRRDIPKLIIGLDDTQYVSHPYFTARIASELDAGAVARELAARPLLILTPDGRLYRTPERLSRIYPTYLAATLREFGIDPGTATRGARFNLPGLLVRHDEDRFITGEGIAPLAEETNLPLYSLYPEKDIFARREQFTDYHELDAFKKRWMRLLPEQLRQLGDPSARPKDPRARAEDSDGESVVDRLLGKPHIVSKGEIQDLAERLAPYDVLTRTSDTDRIPQGRSLISQKVEKLLCRNEARFGLSIHPRQDRGR